MKWWKKAKPVKKEIKSVEYALRWAKAMCNSCDGQNHSNEIIALMANVAEDSNIAGFEYGTISNYIPHCSQGRCNFAKKELDDLIRYRKERLRRKAQEYAAKAKICLEEHSFGEAKTYFGISQEICSKLKELAGEVS